MEPFEIVRQDEDNPRHNVILVRGREYSVLKGTEQEVASEIAGNIDAQA